MTDDTITRQADGNADNLDAPKPRRRRVSRKAKQEAPVAPEAGETTPKDRVTAAQDEGSSPKPKKTRTRRTRKSDPEPQTADQGQGQQQAPEKPQPKAEAEAPKDAPKDSGKDVAGDAGKDAGNGKDFAKDASKQDSGDEAPYRRRKRFKDRDQNDRFARSDRNDRGDRNFKDNRNDRFDRNNRQDRNQKRRAKKANAERGIEPSLSREMLEDMLVAELRSKAILHGVEYLGVHKKELVEAVYQAAALAEGFRDVAGVLDFQNEGHAYVRTGNYMAGDGDAFVHQQMIRQYGLRPGDFVVGAVAPSKPGNKFPPLYKIVSINGKAPDDIRDRPRFRDLTPIYPDTRLVMEHGKDSITGRAIDLVAPIGKGQRGLIVSPPKAGKTTVLKRICQSIAANNPEVHLFCLLVDERPEEVTDMERSIKGEVVASTFDMPASNHTAVAELVIERAKRLVELGEDVVVVLDSITRLARAYNLAMPASGRILSGGVDSAALYPPKKFLGAARNIENGGSLTILASALVDTGSKMDEVIFEEFKGTGNMELKLDRDLADRRIFPAIDPVQSGTRNEDLLISAELQPFVWGIRRILANMNNTERAAMALVKGLKGTQNNEEFLIRSAKKAAQSEYLGA